MAKTGKRYEWEVAKASRNPLAVLFQDCDWAEEVLPTRIGRDWNLTQHRNWLPGLCREGCAKQGSTPDPEVLGVAETSEQSFAKGPGVGRNRARRKHRP